ncbi:MAG: branched-chain amino acid ABC transporter permease [Planctomycetes bacterium]|jgi:branched-chain amino acid transport system permease protein|nr:branched-chain amino acid ABC transporter permease [Planctomycetota bacterium]MCL4730175.1 branched-chain amino acid ABC transporter permease [Planctomycetota bacterium]
MLRTAGILAAGLAAAFALNLLVANAIPPYPALVINLCGISIILAVSLNVINGLTGQFSLGHAGFMAIGAYVSAYFTTTLRYFDPEAARYISQAPLLDGLWGFPLALMAGGIAAAVAGLVVGIPTLRLKGDYLAIATLGFGEIVTILLANFRQVGGTKGLTSIPGHADTFWIYGAASVCITFSLFFQRSTFGRALIAIRENELAAEVMGIGAARMKVIAFIYGAFFAGIAGGLFAHLMLSISPANFGFMKSVEVVVMLVLGGLGSMTGAVVGAVILTILPEALRDIEREVNLSGLRMALYALILILLMLFRPQGIFGQRELSLKLLRRLVPGRRKESP